MNEIKLKPCPFCATKPHTWIESVNSRVIVGHIQCSNPDCRAQINLEYMSKHEILTFDKVIEALNNFTKAWNRRAGESIDLFWKKVGEQNG